MRGCSDFEWNMGRTLLVRNRCHLAAVLEQRVHKIGWRSAIFRVARRLMLAANISAWAGVKKNGERLQKLTGFNSMLSGPLEQLIEGSTEWPPTPGREPKNGEAEMAAALDVCARGQLSFDEGLRRVRSSS